MANQLNGEIDQLDFDKITPVTLTEQHLDEWLRLLDHLQDTHAPTDLLNYCRNQVTRLQLDLYQVRSL